MPDSPQLIIDADAPLFNSFYRRTGKHAGLPGFRDERILHYISNEPALPLIRQPRDDDNRLGVAAQSFLLRFPCQGLLADGDVPASLMQWIGQRVGAPSESGQ
jgi:hypothetical protein